MIELYKSSVSDLEVRQWLTDLQAAYQRIPPAKRAATTVSISSSAVLAVAISVNMAVVLALRLAYWVRVIGSQTTVPVALPITVVDLT
jgi:hypothetical protein